MSTGPNAHHRRERSRLSRLFSKLRILPEERGLDRPQVDAPHASLLPTPTPQVQTQAVAAIHHVEHGNFAPNHGILNQISETHVHTHHTASVLWESLPRQRGTSGHRSKYLEGSRDEDVTQIRNWVETASSELVLWVHGPAGLGKSTLAREVSRDLRMADLLGAFVPLGSLPNDARDPESVIKVIAREIGETYPQAIPAITNAISICKGTPVENHLQVFVGQTVQSLRRGFPIAIILDAFDEWEFSDVLIKDLTCLASLSSVVRFILLGRSDPKSLGHQSPFTRPYSLQPVSTAVMAQYFEREFERVKWEFGRKPSATDVSRLAEQAGGLFIWASTTCSLLDDGRGLTSPNETLEGILDSRRKVGETGHLGSLYGDALRLLFPKEDEQGPLRRYVGMILILQEPLPLVDFSSLSGLSSRSVDMIQARLRALHIRNTVDTPTVHPATTSFHLSFIEYLQHKSTSAGSTPFATSHGSSHSALAKACLQELAAALPVPRDLSESQKQWYAAKHWVLHLSEGAPTVKPGSSSDWEATELCSLVIGISAMTWNWWLTAISRIFILTNAVEVAPVINDTSGLLRDVASRLCGRDPTTMTFRMACLSVATRLQPDCADAWGELGRACSALANVSALDNYLDQAIQADQNAVEAMSDSDPVLIAELGAAFGNRFQRLGAVDDLHQSISLFQQALAVVPSAHPYRWTLLGDLQIFLWSRFKKTRTFEDLQEAIKSQEEVLAVCPFNSPRRQMWLLDLGSLLWSRYEMNQSSEDLDKAITLQEEALALCGAGYRYHLVPLYSLAISLSSRFRVTNSLDDLQRSINFRKEALIPGHPGSPSALYNLASLLNSAFEVTNSLDDLQEAIVFQKEALALCPSGHPDRSSSLCNLALFLESRFRVTNSLEDLQEAIILQKEALALRPSGHPGRSSSLSILGILLISRFEVTKSLDDLQEAIVFQKEALALCPPGHPDRSSSLSILGILLVSRFEVTNSLDDLQEAMILEKEALALRPPGHPDRSSPLRNLATLLSSRFQVTNSFDDLQEAIVLEKEVLALCPPGHPDRSDSLCNLAISLDSRFWVTNSLEDLQEAIILEKEALALRPSGHPDRSISLGNLAFFLQSCFGVTNSLDDLQEAIVLEKEVLALCPSGHPDYSFALNNLGYSLRLRFGVTSSFEDLQEAIILLREALVLRPPGHVYRSSALNNLGHSLRLRFGVTNSFEDLQETIILLREALVLRPSGHLYRSDTLRNLALALESRSQVTGSVEDMDKASALRKELESSRVP